MLAFIVRRLITIIPLLFLISIVSFIVIELPPGDWVTTRIEQLRLSGVEVDNSEVQRLTVQYGLDGSATYRYFRWVTNMLQGDFGYSFQWNQPVSEILAERVPRTMLIAVLSLVVSWIISTPIGILSAVKQYSWVDYLGTFISFIGLATPGFLLALILAYGVLNYLNFSPLGLNAAEFVAQPMSWAKFVDTLKHLALPLIIVGLTGTGVTIRVLRANLLDELKKQYVITARAKGLSEYQLLMKYPVRMAINPLISTIGAILPGLIGGEQLVSIVLSLDTTGPVLLRAAVAQDVYLVGGIVMILSLFALFGTLLSDIALASLDPRIRFGGLKK
ncbi:MAG: ABC transporter permease [Anaerolineae bacterium]|nr:ABC transporter permease [Anaerolineae bacterium]